MSKTSHKSLKMPQIIKYHQWWCKCKDKSSMCEECERALNLLIRHRFWRQWVWWFPEVLHLRVLCHTTIYIYFLVGNPEQNHSSGKSGDLLLRNSRIFFLLILSDSDTEGKSTHAFLDSKFGMQKKKKSFCIFKPTAKLRKLLNTVFSNIYKFSLMVLREKRKVLVMLLLQEWHATDLQFDRFFFPTFILLYGKSNQI